MTPNRIGPPGDGDLYSLTACSTPAQQWVELISVCQRVKPTVRKAKR